MRTILAVIGGGNMARSILSGALTAGVLQPDEIVVADPDPFSHKFFTQRSISCVFEVADLPESSQLLLAVKPQIFASIAGAVSAEVVVSIMAGVPTQTISESIRRGNVIRVMPNLPCSIGLGAAGMALGANTTAQEAALATKLFESIGTVEMVDESLMDAVTAVSGSGPAYLFLLAEAMIEGGVQAGLERKTADALVRQTMVGAAGLLSREKKTATQLREAVTSKGGTTAAALAVMNECGVPQSIIDAVIAARDRGRELCE
ncbi:MAG: pyrroline-5-carboxylate reductase [Planctomycetes bacterium]|nr:pyrroline-5-carboxylate reductase [Planctomycetota bacterium]